MDPYEMRTTGMCRHPCFGALDHVAATALDTSPALFRRRVLRKVIVKLKATIEAGSERLAVENDCPDECCGVVTVLSQQLGHRRMRSDEGNAEIRNAM